MFTVHANLNPNSRASIPWLLAIQDDLLTSLATRVVVPLYLKGGATPQVARLTPLMVFRGKTYVAMVPELAGVPRTALGPEAGELAAQRPAVMAALDLLFSGI